MAIEKPGQTTSPTNGPAKDQAFAAYDQFNILMEWCSCDIDILEEFAHLYTDDSYNLDLVPVATSGSR